MVSAWLLGAALAAAGPAAVDTLPVPAPVEDPFPTLVREDAELDAAADGEFVGEDERGVIAPPIARPGGARWSRGRLAWIGGARTLVAAAGLDRVRAELLLAREDGEPRAIDDAYASLTIAPAARTIARLGWFEPGLGAGLLLGPRRVTPEAVAAAIAPARAAAATAAWFATPLSAVPARAATGLRGIALEHARGPWRVGAFAAHTPREARASGAALRPLLGVRHRNAAEAARRGALEEGMFALAASFAPPPTRAHGRFQAWAMALLARSDPRRAPYEGSAAAAESAAAIVRGGEGFELGAAWARGGEALLVAAAFDPRGRARTRLTASTHLPGARRTRAGLVLETEARGYLPARALPERRSRAHAGVLVERGGARAWSLEAHAVDRGPYAEARAWLVARLDPAPGLRLELRHDARPQRTLAAARVGMGAISGGAEVRLDPAGLARRSGWVAVRGTLPGGLAARIESRLGGGRSAPVWLDTDRPGGSLVRPGRAAARTRIELARPGRVEPRLAWTQIATPDGRSGEVRLAVHWFIGSLPRGSLDDPSLD